MHGAISDASVCAVSALRLVYVMVLLDPSNGYVSSLDSFVGLAWFVAALVYALDMALSEQGRKTALMFHHFGYRLRVVAPSLVALWLYDYNTSNSSEPIAQFISLYQTAAHRVFFLVLICMWGGFVVLQAGRESLKFEARWPDRILSCDVGTSYCLYHILKLIGSAGPIIISVSAALSAHTRAQSILAWTLTGKAGVNAFDMLDLLSRPKRVDRARDHIVAICANDPAAVILGRKIV